MHDSRCTLYQHCRDATEKISRITNEDAPPTSITSCDSSLVGLLQRQASRVLVVDSHVRRLGHDGDHSISSEIAAIEARLADLIVWVDRRFYVARFDTVSKGWREMYTAVRAVQFHLGVLASCLSGGTHYCDRLAQSGDVDRSIEEKEVDLLVAMLDYALIVTGAPGLIAGATWINRALVLLEQTWIDLFVNKGKVEPRRPIQHDQDNNKVTKENIEATRRPIHRTPSMDMGQFEDHMAYHPHPIIFTDLITHWPAFAEHPWKSVDYLLAVTFGGRRLVPVEIGRSYVDEGWGQRLIPLYEFISRWLGGAPSGSDINNHHPSSPPQSTGYLAQHDLFAQIPALANDILIPDLCYADTLPICEPQRPLLNAWFGPRGTITPLHTDPYHNLYCQVVGKKYIRLYAPEKTEDMRPRGVEEGIDLGNTAGWDVGAVEGWDEDREGMEDEERKRLGEIEYVDCVLDEGDVLYIPKGWWHYCRGMSVSFGVSFWWG